MRKRVQTFVFNPDLNLANQTTLTVNLSAFMNQSTVARLRSAWFAPVFNDLLVANGPRRCDGRILFGVGVQRNSPPYTSSVGTTGTNAFGISANQPFEFISEDVILAPSFQFSVELYNADIAVYGLNYTFSAAIVLQVEFEDGLND